MKPYTTVKLLVVGWQEKGKTTLVHRLEGDFRYFEREVTPGKVYAIFFFCNVNYVKYYSFGQFN